MVYYILSRNAMSKKYELKQGGTGSGVKFIKDGSNEVINFHKPHPNGI